MKNMCSSLSGDVFHYYQEGTLSLTNLIFKQKNYIPGLGNFYGQMDSSTTL